MNKLITPIPNLNGNDAVSLVTQLSDILSALHGLEKAIRHANPCWHGRNFQTHPEGQEAQRRAQDAWGERQKWLAEFEIEIEDMALEIQRGAR